MMTFEEKGKVWINGLFIGGPVSMTTVRAVGRIGYKAGYAEAKREDEETVKMLFDDREKDAETIKRLREALTEISGGISPMGGIVTPDGHRRLIAKKALKAGE